MFELLLALASVPAIRLMITRLVFAPVQTKDCGEEELLQHIFYLAKRSVAVDNGASVSAIKLITYIYEVLTIARYVQFQARLFFWYCGMDKRQQVSLTFKALLSFFLMSFNGSSFFIEIQS